METRRRQMAEFSSWIEWRRKYAQKGLVWPLLLSQSFLQSAPFIPIIMRAWPIVAEVTIENPLPLSRDRRHHFQTWYLFFFSSTLSLDQIPPQNLPKGQNQQIIAKLSKRWKLPGPSLFSQEKKSLSTVLPENIRYDYIHFGIIETKNQLFEFLLRLYWLTLYLLNSHHVTTYKEVINKEDVYYFVLCIHMS